MNGRYGSDREVPSLPSDGCVIVNGETDWTNAVFTVEGAGGERAHGGGVLRARA